jgi:hypothetical protein
VVSIIILIQKPKEMNEGERLGHYVLHVPASMSYSDLGMVPP